MVLGWIIGITLALVVIVAFYFIGARNKIVRLENRIDNAWAQIDVQLKRRADLIPNLVNTVKGYASHEKEVLENVTKARASLMSAKTPQDSMAAEGFLEQALGKLFAVAEAYPDLKANQNFLQLQDELTHTENKVGFARQHYNDAVLSFNNTVEQFPSNMVANAMGKKERAMLEVAPVDRAVPDVSF